MLASNAVAVPLSAAFPASEVKYILDNSGSSMIVSSEKFRSKADDVLAAGLEQEPTVLYLPKRMQGTTGANIELQQSDQTSQSGMMLYTSGTTSRPVCTPRHCRMNETNKASRKECCSLKTI